MPLRQARGLPVTGTTTVATFVTPPLEGSLVLVGILATAAHAEPPLGFDLIAPFAPVEPGDVGLEVYATTALAGDDGEYILGFAAEWWIAEVTGVADGLPIDTVILDEQTSDHPSVSMAPAETDPILVVGAWLKKPAYVTNVTEDPGWTFGAARQQDANTIGFGFVYAELADGLDTYDPGVTDTGGASPWAFVGLAFLLDAPVAPEPPVDPGYEVPDAGRAILEIYVHDEDATRWGTATWGDNPPTGTTGIWSGAGWQDVTPQGVNAHVIWGARRPERGILATQDPATWQVQTYDPDRVLDPGNPDSPYYPQLIAGVPIRIRNEASGTTIRTGIIERIAYRYRAPEYRGEIRATSTIAIAHKADVPEDTVLPDDLRGRIQDATTASGVAIGGIPLLGSDDSYPEVPLSARIDGKASLWEHIRKAGEEVLWVIYEDAAGTLQSRPWGGPLDRGSEITYENLEDLEASSSDEGKYSVVYVTNEDGSAEIERVAAPLPRYGRVPYTRSETTIDPEAWADALLADRSWPGLMWTPGVVWCFDADDVAFMAGLEIMERVAIVVPGVVEVTGRLLGMELWVEARDTDRARWLFLPRIATDGSTAIGDVLLVSDDDGSYLLSDDDGSYMEPDDE